MRKRRGHRSLVKRKRRRQRERLEYRLFSGSDLLAWLAEMTDAVMDGRKPRRLIRAGQVNAL